MRLGRGGATKNNKLFAISLWAQKGKRSKDFQKASKKQPKCNQKAAKSGRGKQRRAKPGSGRLGFKHVLQVAHRLKVMKTQAP